eukprot:4960600-Prymnesium_polylepis.1
MQPRPSRAHYRPHALADGVRLLVRHGRDDPPPLLARRGAAVYRGQRDAAPRDGPHEHPQDEAARAGAGADRAQRQPRPDLQVVQGGPPDLRVGGADRRDARVPRGPLHDPVRQLLPSRDGAPAGAQPEVRPRRGARHPTRRAARDAHPLWKAPQPAA